jgi:hypothetical protein
VRIISEGPTTTGGVLLVGEAIHIRLLALPKRVRSKITLDGTGCWLWQGAKGSELRYGQTQWDGRVQPVHVVVYKLFNGLIPQGLELDHLCRVNHCCNPDHLEAVTHAENVRRGTAADHVILKWLTATHCQGGHPFIVSNIYREPNGKRRCLECKRQRMRNFRQRKRIAEAKDLRCFLE